MSHPIIIDLGKVKKKAIKDLRRGHGKLLHEVNEAVEQVKSGLGADAEGKEFVPVVIMYKKKDKKPKMKGLLW